MAISSLGLGSGLDIRSMVEGLVNAERAPQEFQLTKQETNLQAKLSSYGVFKSALSDFRSSLSGLRRESQFGALKATSSDDSVITASVSSNAGAGSYSIEAKQLARSHSLASNGFDEANATVGTGTLTIKFGETAYDSDTDNYTGFNQNAEKGTLSIELDSTNNTLVGMRDAINEADGGVTASIVNDGSAYRLVLSSDDTGEENSLQISVDDPSLSQFEFNESATNIEQTQGAQDAVLSLNGLDVTNASNSFTKTLKGVSVNLNNAVPGQQIKLDVAVSSGDVVSSLNSFVENYNALIEGVDSLSGYNKETQEGSTLIGDTVLRSGMSQIRSVLGGMVSGLENTSIRTLNDLGIESQLDGTLTFDESKFTTALNNDADGVAAVFVAIGRPTNENVGFFSSESETPMGSYSVDVSQAATKGVLTGVDNSVNSLVISAGVNDTFKINVNGSSSGDITLTEGSYASGDDLAAEIQSRINGDSLLKNKNAKVQVAYDNINNRFDITSDLYGTESKVEITSSTANDIGMATATGTDGLDIIGSIGGMVTTGEGQYLTASNGLKLFVENEVSGSLGTVNFSRGLMESMDNILGGLLDQGGTLEAKTTGIQKSLDLIGDERIKLGDTIESYESRLLKQFNSMDSLLGRIQSTGSFLTQQLASLPLNNSSRK